MMAEMIPGYPVDVTLPEYAFLLAKALENAETDSEGMVTMTPELRDYIVANLRHLADKDIATHLRYRKPKEAQ